MIGYLFFLSIFIFLYIGFIPKRLYPLFSMQLLILFILLVTSNFLSYHYGYNYYPAIFADGFKYHLIGKIWADNVGFIPRISDVVVIAEKWPLYINQMGWDLIDNPFSFLAPTLIHIPTDIVSTVSTKSVIKVIPLDSFFLQYIFYPLSIGSNRFENLNLNLYNKIKKNNNASAKK